MIIWSVELSRKVRVPCERIARVKGRRRLVIRRSVLRGILIRDEIERKDCMWAVEYRIRCDNYVDHFVQEMSRERRIHSSFSINIVKWM